VIKIAELPHSCHLHRSEMGTNRANTSRMAFCCKTVVRGDPDAEESFTRLIHTHSSGIN
jgi:hypothetical protein